MKNTTTRKISLKDYNAMAYAEREALPEKTKAAFDRENACEFIRDEMKKDARVFTLLRHVSPSGMTRRISCFIARDNQIIDITYYVAKVLEVKRHRKDGGIVVSGCGMDMGFDLVYRLSGRLYGYEDSGAYRINQSWM